jgi:hypothetical protein
VASTATNFHPPQCGCYRGRAESTKKTGNRQWTQIDSWQDCKPRPVSMCMTPIRYVCGPRMSRFTPPLGIPAWMKRESQGGGFPFAPGDGTSRAKHQLCLGSGREDWKCCGLTHAVVSLLRRITPKCLEPNPERGRPTLSPILRLRLGSTPYFRAQLPQRSCGANWPIPLAALG